MKNNIPPEREINPLLTTKIKKERKEKKDAKRLLHDKEQKRKKQGMDA